MKREMFYKKTIFSMLLMGGSGSQNILEFYPLSYAAPVQ